jgi:hypothetical protein
MASKKKLIKVDFESKQQIVSGGKCLKCGNWSNFSISADGDWELIYHYDRESGKGFVSCGLEMLGDVVVRCQYCDEEITDEKFLEEIHDDFSQGVESYKQKYSQEEFDELAKELLGEPDFDE